MELELRQDRVSFWGINKGIVRASSLLKIKMHAVWVDYINIDFLVSDFH